MLREKPVPSHTTRSAKLFAAGKMIPCALDFPAAAGHELLRRITRVVSEPTRTHAMDSTIAITEDVYHVGRNDRETHGDC